MVQYTTEQYSIVYIFVYTQYGVVYLNERIPRYTVLYQYYAAGAARPPGSGGVLAHQRHARHPTILYYAILCYTMLYFAILCYAMLYYTTLYYTILYNTILCYTTLYYTTLCYTILHYTILSFTILHYTLLYYTLRRLGGAAAHAQVAFGERLSNLCCPK